MKDLMFKALNPIARHKQEGTHHPATPMLGTWKIVNPKP